ncbi:MAG: hypothetical protein IJH07_00090 [Ruminococcus sp.]|nr:hypothetical protein [Ruminococcus sp.]
MHKKEYLRPELSVMLFTLRDVILTSPEDLSSSGTGGSEIDPILPDEPDDPIEW